MAGNDDERRAEQRIKVRQVTNIQASWTEGERGDDGQFTLQLILDHGAAEYVLAPSEDDLDVLLTLFKRCESATFDMDRKVLMFGNLAIG